MTADPDRLRATLGRPELARLLARIRARLERGVPLTGHVSLPDPALAERDAVDRLLGRPPSRGASLSVSLAQLEQKLKVAGLAPSLREAVEILAGPVFDRRAERAKGEQEWDELFSQAGERLGEAPQLQAWLAQLKAAGQLRRYGLTEARQLLTRAMTVLVTLPARDVPLAELAASLLGDAHALDPDTALGAITLRAVATLADCPPLEDASSRREAWGRVGVICEELSGPVLVWNLRAGGGTPLSQILAIAAGAGEPIYVTTRQLLQPGLVCDSRQTAPVIFICENPSVVAAAARRLGRFGKPLVCIEGQPRTSTRLLLNQLRAAQIELRYHGDFDWPGIQIANTIMERHGALPWRMAAGDYRRAATGCATLTGNPVAASWEPELVATMIELGQAVHEERVTDVLLGDLGM